MAKATGLAIDLKKIIRLRKPEKHQARLTNRPDTDLIRASDIAGNGRQAFLPDTNVYIMDAAWNGDRIFFWSLCGAACWRLPLLDRVMPRAAK